MRALGPPRAAAPPPVRREGSGLSIGHELAAHLAREGVDTLEQLVDVPGGDRYP
ncbi:MAG: hypothetical protein IE923_00655 [Micrococcales bacterium]|nr:hypothetical protein [Micrococcales bacterium]